MEQAKLPRRRISRELTRIANAPVDEVIGAIGETDAPPGYRIGVTGPPGAGKSTLITGLAARRLRKTDVDTLAVLAIDPSSPMTGGAILGDRIRMDAVADLPGLFIRSLSSRGARNGLCDNVVDLLILLESHGFDEIVLETVGLGQSEVAVHDVVDTMIVIVPPDAGDSVQTMKSGILELADIVVVTKADQPGAKRMVSDLDAVLSTRNGWRPPLVRTEIEGAGLDELDAAIDGHHDWLRRERPQELSREKRRRYHLHALIDRRVTDILRTDDAVAKGALAESYERLLALLRRP